MRNNQHNSQEGVSLPRRYFSKLLSNSLNFLGRFISVSIVPRTLGPGNFGNFVFLNRSFQAVVNFLDFSAATAYFTKISKSQDIRKISFLYLVFSLITGIGLFIAISLIIYFGKVDFFWPGQSIIYVFAGALLGLAIAYVARLTSLADGKEITIGVELRRAVWVIAFNIILLTLFFTHRLNLATYFIYQIASYIVLMIVIARFIKKSGIYNFGFTRLSYSEIKGLLRYFYRYCHPLFIASLFGFGYTFFDAWFLQRIGGSVAQGMYGLAYNLGAVCFLFIGSVTPIYMQSFAKAHGQNDFARIRKLFNKIQLFYFMSAFFAVFFFLHVKELIMIFGGKAFLGARIPLMIMVFYPVHQTFGQLNDGLLLAMEKTNILRNVGILTSIVAIIVTYFLLAPTTNFLSGLQLGATGLAIKMVLIQFIGVNITLYISCRLLKISYLRCLVNQIFVFIPLFVIGSVILYLERLYFQGLESLISLIYRLIFSGAVYFICIILLCWIFPGVAGLDKNEPKIYLGRLKMFLSNIRLKNK